MGDPASFHGHQVSPESEGRPWLLEKIDAVLGRLESKERKQSRLCRDCRLPMYGADLLLRPQSRVCSDCRLRRRLTGNSATRPFASTWSPAARQ